MYARYVCVRVTDMRGVDLVRTAFDFDLTFSMLLMHPDGHVYHRYGGRDERGANVWLSPESVERVLVETLDEHDSYCDDPWPPESRRPLRIEDIASFQKRDKGECIHCHSVFPAFYEEARDAKEWGEDDRWVYPPPRRIGIDLDQHDQALVSAVTPDSVAAAAGLAVGDRLVRSGSQWLLTSSDLSQVLHDFSADGGVLRIDVERDGVSRVAELELSAGWKRGTPLEFSWRPFKWGFTPSPGFGGRSLSSQAKRELGLDASTFAFRVNYFETWGENRRYGDAAIRSGLRENDVFLSAAGKRDFATIDHFHAWWRLTRTVGERILIELVRDGMRRTFTLEVLR